MTQAAALAYQLDDWRNPSPKTFPEFERLYWAANSKLNVIEIAHPVKRLRNEIVLYGIASKGKNDAVERGLKAALDVIDNANESCPDETLRRALCIFDVARKLETPA